MKNIANEYYDLTAVISESTVVFPGDPQFGSEDIYTIDGQSKFHLCHLHFGNHTGTHIDFPSHVIKAGKTSSDYPLTSLIGRGLIVEVSELVITKKLIENLDTESVDFIFFKTHNSNISKNAEFTNQYVYMDVEAAKSLVSKKVKIVGIDYISIDKYDDEELPVHKALLSNDILIVEGLELCDVKAGRYKIYIMPLNIKDMDGLPVRVMAKPE